LSNKFHNVAAWGDEEKELLQIQQKFLKYIPRKGSILDLGSGRGIFLHLAEESGHKVLGVEMDKTMFDVSKNAGYNVKYNDALSFLKTNKTKYDAIFASHIIEHMDIKDGIKFIDLMKKSLNKGGVIIIVTPRPGSLWATENFWLDTTHIRPYPLNLMSKLLSPLEIVDSGIEPDSYALKHAGKTKKILNFFRKIIIGKELFDFTYGGGVWFIVAKNV
jgi:2-polyprenyl-3-methyl-5-hydroxy-6-metoxy-1,4-benzoquinol methylase